jgi:hypothetical protein
MTDAILWVLVGLGVAIILLVRLRLAGSHEHAGRSQVPVAYVNVYALIGFAALGLLVAYILTGMRVIAYAVIPVGWVFALIGLGMLMRWMPRRSKHAAGPIADSWTRGPVLSILAHTGVLLGVIIATFIIARAL